MPFGLISICRLLIAGLFFSTLSMVTPKASSPEYDGLMIDLLVAARGQNYHQVEDIFQNNPDFVAHSNTLSCTALCELSQLFERWHPTLIDADIYAESITIALDYGARANSSFPAQTLIAASNSALAGSTEEQLPISTSECLPERDILVPLAHRLALQSFEADGWSFEPETDTSSGTVEYVWWICHWLTVCGASYEATAPELTDHLKSALGTEGRRILIALTDVGMIDEMCVAHYL